MIGQKIKQLRGDEPQDSFAKRFGVSRSTILRYESGHRKPDSDFIVALCRQYNVDSNWLLLDESDNKPQSIQNSPQTEKCDHEALKLHRKGHIFEKDPGFNPELMGQIYSQLSDFKENNPGDLTKEKELDVLIMAYSLCQPELRKEAKLICAILSSIINGE